MTVGGPTTAEEATEAAARPVEKAKEPKDYAQLLAEKVKAQADELREQAEQVEDLARYTLLCEEALRGLDPQIVLPLEIPSEALDAEHSRSYPRKGPAVLYKRNSSERSAHEAAINLLESRAFDLEAKWSNAHKTNLELRTVLDKREKELALARLKISKMMENMKAFEAAKLSAEEHAHQLEANLVAIDKGQTAAGSRVGTKLRQTLDKRARANNALTAITTAQEREIEGLQRGVLELRHALNTEAKRLGLSGVDAILEASQLREAAAESIAKQEGLREQLTDARRALKEGEAREAALLEQQTEWEMSKPELERLKAAVAKLEGDNTALLDYIQELSDARTATEKEAAEAKMEVERLAGAKAAIEAAQSAVSAKDAQLEQVYEQLKEVRAEVVRVRGERLEDIGKLDTQAEEAQGRLRQQIEAVKAEKASLEAKLQDHQARAGALEQQQWERLGDARKEMEEETERMRTAMREDFDRRAEEAREAAQIALQAAEGQRDAALQEMKEVQLKLESLQKTVGAMQTEAQSVMERKSLVEMRLAMLEEEKHGQAQAAVSNLEQAERLAQAEVGAEALRHQLEAMQAESKRSLESMEADLKEWMAKAKHAQDRYAELEATTRMSDEDSRRRVAAAEAQVKSLNEMLGAQAEEVGDYRRRMLLHVSSAHGGDELLEGREKALQGMVEELQQKLQRSESQLAKWMSARDLTEELEAAKAAQARQLDEIRRLDTEKGGLQRQLKQAQQEAEAVEGILMGAGVDVPEVHEIEGAGVYRDPTGPARELVSRFKRLQTYASSESAKAQGLEDELASRRSMTDAEARNAQMREQQLKSELNQITSAMRSSGLEAADGHVVVELCAALADLSVKQGEASAANLRIQGLEEDLEAARRAASEAKAAGSREAEEAQARLEDLRRHFEGELSDAKSQEEDLRSRLGAAEGRADNLQTQLIRLEADLSRAEARCTELTHELQVARNAASQAESSAEASEARAKALGDTVDERDAEMDRLRRLLRSSKLANTQMATPATQATPAANQGAQTVSQRYRELALSGHRAGSRIPVPGSRQTAASASSTAAALRDNEALSDLPDHQQPVRRRLSGAYQSNEDSSDDDADEYDDAASAVSAPPRIGAAGPAALSSAYRLRQVSDSGTRHPQSQPRDCDSRLRESLSATERLRRARAQM